MRAAPAVRVSVRPGALARGGPALLVALAAASAGAWLLAHTGQPAAWALALMPPVAWWCWRAADGPAVALAWDGQHWHCDGQPGRATLQLDLPGALLLRWVPEATAATGPIAGRRAARWLLPTEAQCGADWHGLRVALLAGAGPARLDPPLTP